MARQFSVAALLLLLFTLAGCTTAYGPHSVTGGYKEKQVDEDSYIVSFYGNGHTPEQQVWNYWIYRCAELTKEKGFEYFDLVTSEEQAGWGPQGERPVTFTMLDSSGQESDNTAGFSPVYYYVTTITTYSSNALVNMYNNPVPDDVKGHLHAQTILDALAPYVASKAKATPPEREALYVRAIVEAAIRSGRVEEAEAQRLRERIQTL